MGTAFSQSDAILLSKDWRTHTVYTWGPQSLATGQTTIFTGEQWNPDQETAPEWMVELVAVWVTQSSGVQLSWVADGVTFNQGSTQGFTDAAPGGVRRLPVYARAVKQLSMTANNTSGAAISNFQINYEIVFRRLTIADKLLYGYGFSPEDDLVLATLGGTQDPTDQAAIARGLAQVKALVERGTAPIPWIAQYERTLRNRRLNDHPSGGLWHVTAGTGTAGTKFGTATPANGEFLVLEEVAVPAATAITLYVDRDSDQGLLTLNGAAFGQVNYAPWTTEVIATSQLAFRAKATATTNNVPVWLKIGRYKTSNIWRVRLGKAKSAGSVPGDVWAKSLAGMN